MVICSLKELPEFKNVLHVPDRRKEIDEIKGTFQDLVLKIFLEFISISTLDPSKTICLDSLLFWHLDSVIRCLSQLSWCIYQRGMCCFTWGDVCYDTKLML